jgi:hypothetical protein
VIELPRKRAVSMAALFVGGVFLLLGAVALPRAPLAANVFFIVLGALLALLGGSRVIARTPRFRANAEGVWFGGGAVIPWSDVKQVFESGVTVDGRKTSGIAFELRDRKTLFKTPIENWLSTPFAVGDIDVSPSDRESTTVLVSRLEAMRQSLAG